MAVCERNRFGFVEVRLRQKAGLGLRTPPLETLSAEPRVIQVSLYTGADRRQEQLILDWREWRSHLHTGVTTVWRFSIIGHPTDTKSPSVTRKKNKTNSDGTQMGTKVMVSVKPVTVEVLMFGIHFLHDTLLLRFIMEVCTVTANVILVQNRFWKM